MHRQPIPLLLPTGVGAPGTMARSHPVGADSHPRSIRPCPPTRFVPRAITTPGPRLKAGSDSRSVAWKNRGWESAPTGGHPSRRSGIRPRTISTSPPKTGLALGFTLIEFIVALVIIGIAGAALLSAFITPVANSADPQLIAQARAVGTSYLDEILLRDFGTGPGDCNGANRSEYDTIWCYDGLNESPTDQFGNTIGALTDYNVTTAVSGNASQAAIVVRVQHDSGSADITLESRRGNF